MTNPKFLLSRTQLEHVTEPFLLAGRVRTIIDRVPQPMLGESKIDSLGSLSIRQRTDTILSRMKVGSIRSIGGQSRNCHRCEARQVSRFSMECSDADVATVPTVAPAPRGTARRKGPATCRVQRLTLPMSPGPCSHNGPDPSLPLQESGTSSVSP